MPASAASRRHPRTVSGDHHQRCNRVGDEQRADPAHFVEERRVLLDVHCGLAGEQKGAEDVRDDHDRLALALDQDCRVRVGLVAIPARAG